MSRLRVIVVPPDFKRTFAYEVVLGDCILKGFVLGTYPILAKANEACDFFATHYELTACPMTDENSPEARRQAVPGYCRRERAMSVEDLATANIADILKQIHDFTGTPAAVRIPALVAWVRSAYMVQHPKAPEPRASLISAKALKQRRTEPR
jgi:hypothetical protein